jgi:arylsulfatase A-like enzyme
MDSVDASRPKNVIWIMCDQLRHDYLGCTGHPTLKTPNIDAMAKRGVRFSNAYVQSPICGPARPACTGSRPAAKRDHSRYRQGENR